MSTIDVHVTWTTQVAQNPIRLVCATKVKGKVRTMTGIAGIF